MATTNKIQYGTSNQSITITLTSLANNGQRGSVFVNNSVNLFLEASVFVKIRTAAAATSTTGTVNVYAYGTTDTGTTYSDSITGTDALQTLTNPPNLKLIGIINAVANSTTYNAGPFPVSPIFGGFLPERWGLVIENKTGATLDASIGSAWYQGLFIQNV
jgi:hypothetical protein